MPSFLCDTDTADDRFVHTKLSSNRPEFNLWLKSQNVAVGKKDFLKFLMNPNS